MKNPGLPAPAGVQDCFEITRRSHRLIVLASLVAIHIVLYMVELYLSLPWTLVHLSESFQVPPMRPLVMQLRLCHLRSRQLLLPSSQF